MKPNLNFSTKMNILHITDFHLNNFDGENEFLRRGFYKEYINRLFQSLNKEVSTIIHQIIITGDLIDRGKIENFEHINVIVEYIANKFSVHKKNVHFCIGNHDYKYKELNEGDIEAEKSLKVPFRDTVKYFNPKFEVETDYFTINKINDSTIFLSLDSTWNSEGGNPGILSTPEVDKLINSILELTDENSTILIGCHFPIISFSDNFLAFEEDNWHSKHSWIKGSELHDRIKRLHIKNTIWFHGDVHAGDARKIDNEIFVLTSKFGGAIDQTEQRRQANLIILEEDNISKITFSYEFPTHGQSPNLGDWQRSEKRLIRQSVHSDRKVEYAKEELLPLNIEVESEILRKIKDKNLYKFGRFQVNDDYISLGWVEIGKLLTDKELLNRISDKAYELIQSKRFSKSSETLFLGIEIIGGILASQLSVRFNINNSIIPVRTKIDHYSELEMSYSSAFDNIAEIKDLVIFIDIISSGNTINNLVEEILDKNKNINIHVIAIISNDIENKLIKIPNTKSYHTFCTNLKIPTIKNSEMPNEDFVKPNLKH